jgi:hypothetical protein
MIPATLYVAERIEENIGIHNGKWGVEAFRGRLVVASCFLPFVKF